MTRERLDQIEEIYDAALKLGDGERKTFILNKCGDDDELRNEVESLLAFGQSDIKFLDESPDAVAADMFAVSKSDAVLEGRKIGRYSVKSLLGRGGMGEVYLAEDSRLNRRIAIKLLPHELTGNVDRLNRFEREAQAVSALNHPNILTIHEFPTEGEEHFIVMEFVDGETLGDRMQQGRMSFKEILDVAVQVSSALSAAHEAGIIHRDVKPDNIMIREDGIVKVLDFGLAKLTEKGRDIHITGSSAETRPMVVTNPGSIMGTTNYMSPEQARGRQVDARSDIFSFGVVLYEMLAGRPPFTGESPVEVMGSIIKDDPEDLTEIDPRINPALVRIVRTCLEKKPERRFYSAHDLGFALESVTVSSTNTNSSFPPMPTPARPQLITRERLGWLLATLFAIVAIGGIAYAWKLRTSQAPQRAFRQLNFRREAIFQASFAPDGQTVVYSGATDGNTPEIFTVRADSPVPQSVGSKGMHLLDVSSKGELAVLTDAKYLRHRTFVGTLAQMPLIGGAPRSLLEGVKFASWSPDGSQLAVIREVEGKDRLEYPAGKVLREVGGNMSDCRVSPDGKRIAFFEHPIKNDDGGSVNVIDLDGNSTVLSDNFWSERGLGWSPDSKEVIFSASLNSGNFMIFAVALDGTRRIADQSPGGLILQAVAPDGRWLVNRLDYRYAAMVHSPGSPEDRDLSWLRGSKARIMSQDGQTLFFLEDGAGKNSVTCMRKVDGSPLVRLGEGAPLDLAPGGRSVLSLQPGKPGQLVILPTGVGAPTPLDRGPIVSYVTGQWFRDGNRILFSGNEADKGIRFYVQDINGGPPQAVSPEGARDGKLSPDGKQLLARGGDGKYNLYPIDGGDPKPVWWLTGNDVVVQWSGDGKSWYVYQGSEIPCRVERVNTETGKRETFRSVAPAYRTGILSVRPSFFTDDEGSYSYTTYQQVSTLFVTE